MFNDVWWYLTDQQQYANTQHIVSVVFLTQSFLRKLGPSDLYSLTQMKKMNLIKERKIESLCSLTCLTKIISLINIHKREIYSTKVTLMLV